MGDNALAADRLAFATDVAKQVLLSGFGCIADYRVRDLRVVDDLLAFAIEGALQLESGRAIPKKDETTLAAGEAQGVLDHSMGQGTVSTR